MRIKYSNFHFSHPFAMQCSKSYPKTFFPLKISCRTENAAKCHFLFKWLLKPWPDVPGKQIFHKLMHRFMFDCLCYCCNCWCVYCCELELTSLSGCGPWFTCEPPRRWEIRGRWPSWTMNDMSIPDLPPQPTDAAWVVLPRISRANGARITNKK